MSKIIGAFVGSLSNRIEQEIPNEPNTDETLAKKIIGVTVGTPISPAKIEEEIKPIKRINGIEPDDNGNVEVSGGSVATVTKTVSGVGSIMIDDVSPIGHNVVVTLENKNILNNHTVNGNETKYGITLTENGDGTYTIKGTATENVAFYIHHASQNPLYLKRGVTYTISGGISGKVGVYVYRQDWNEMHGTASAESHTFTIDDDSQPFGSHIYITNGTTVDGVIKPMLEVSDTATEFVPNADISMSFVSVEDENGDAEVYYPNEDGVISDIKSLSPIMQLQAHPRVFIITATYERDLSKVIADLEERQSEVVQGEKGEKGDTGEKGEKGDKGDKGDTGADGASVTVENVSESSADGGSNVVTFSDGTTLTVKNGSKGSQGEKGDKGEKGDTGAQGAKGDKGDTGAQGIQGEKGADGYTPIKGVDYFDGKNGADGKDGSDGRNGVDAIIDLEETENGFIAYFTDELNGTRMVEIRHGEKGDKGDKGDTGAQGIQGEKGDKGDRGLQGEQGIQGVQGEKGDTGAKGEKGDKGADGAKGADGKTPVKGTDYWTPEDIMHIKSELISEIVTQEAGESESLVMSQKAVTDLVAEAVGSGGGTSAEYETVDSVEDMTDTSKQYVLKETGTIWTYGEFTEEVNVNEQIFDPSRVNKWHMSGTANLVTNNSYNLYLMHTDVSQIPEGTDVYVEIEGLYIRNTTSPYIEKIGYSPLENPVIGTDVLLKCAYADSTNMGDSFVNTSKGCKLHLGYFKEEKITNWDDIKTLMVEVANSQTPDTSTIKAYLQYSYTGTVSKWYDTGLAPSSGGGGGGNYVELLVKVNKNTSDIAEVGKRVTALETGSDSVTIPTFWQSAVDACISKIKALQVGRNCVTFPFFSDNHQNIRYAGVLIAHIMKECNIPYCFFGGDSISNGIIADEATMIAQDKAFDTMMSYVPNGRMCRAVGNHDGFWNDGTNKYWYNRDQVYDLFLREESIAQNKHFGGEGTYYYVDDIASKVRWIVMDTNNAPVDDAQIAWVQNTALSFDESDWAVVFISHQPISNHYHAGITNASAVVSAIVSTANSKNIPIVGWYSGHVHRDIIATKLMSGGNGSNAGTEGASLGFTQVIITSDHTGIAYDDATKHTVANDDQSHAIDFITINKSTRTVNITRLGIGSDRSYSY